ncbi:MAG: hypothetical protein J6K82_01020 [Alphaproteobacteria bacterium]|nr:hypothetical protein [Alphaproteobacteria bacterium]
MKTKFLTFLSMIVAIGIGVNSAWGGTCGDKSVSFSRFEEPEHRNFLYSNKYDFDIADWCHLNKQSWCVSTFDYGEEPKKISDNVYKCDTSDCGAGTFVYMKPNHYFDDKNINEEGLYICVIQGGGNTRWYPHKVERCPCDLSKWTKIKTVKNASDDRDWYYKIEKDTRKSCYIDKTDKKNCGCLEGTKGYNVGEDVGVSCSSVMYLNGIENATKCYKVCVDGGKWETKIKECKGGYRVADDGFACVEATNTPSTTTSTPSTNNGECSPDELNGKNASKGKKSGDTCIATKCKDGAYLVVKDNQSQGWCVFPTFCKDKPNTKLNIINNDKTDLQCVPIEPSEPAAGEEPVTEAPAEEQGDVSTSGDQTPADTSATEQEACAKVGRWALGTCVCNDIYKQWNHDKLDCEYIPYMPQQTNTECIDAGGTWTMDKRCICPEEKERKGQYCVEKSGAPTDTPTTGQDPCAAGGGTPGDDGACDCGDGKMWDDTQKQCVGATDAGGDAITSEEAPSGENTDVENSDSQDGESAGQDVAQETPVDPAVECSENGGKWDAQSNQCITPEMQREIDRQKSQENVDKLKADADAAREREQSTENKLIGAAGIGATGIGGMMLAQSAAENAADDDAERAMRAYLATFRCDYGGGKTVRGGEQEIELPGGNELINLYSEYIALANDLKVRKEQLGLKPGIESEPILDGATSGLYDDIAVGKTGGAYTSLARALMDPKGADAAAWAAQRAETAKNLKTGAITAGVGAGGSMIGNLAINSGEDKKNKANEIERKYDAKKVSGDTINANKNTPTEQ